MEAYDIGIDNDNELQFQDGDFAIVKSDELHVKNIFISSKGNWRNSPLTGVGIRNYINSPDSILTRNQLMKQIRLQLEFDGYKIGVLKVDSIESPTVTLKRVK